jgi:hypothetical protein
MAKPTAPVSGCGGDEDRGSALASTTDLPLTAASNQLEPLTVDDARAVPATLPKGCSTEIELQTLLSNPFRDFTVDPIDDDAVATLAQSIEKDGFWGGVVCRRVGDEVQICAGHHRVKAAIQAGIKRAAVFVGNFDDEAAVRVYARENATQRGNHSAAVAGSVLAAVHFLARDLATGGRHIGGFSPMSDKAIESSVGNLQSEKGIGRRLVAKFLEGVPGVNESIVGTQLANLKASGDYGRVIEQVHQELKAEAQAVAARDVEKKAAAEAAVEVSAKASGKANESDSTFDLAGVSKLFKNPDHVNTFRKFCLNTNVVRLLSPDQHAPLARKLIALAKDWDIELTSGFIRQRAMALLSNARYVQRRITAEEQRDIERASREEKMRGLVHRVTLCLNGVAFAFRDICELEKAWPKDQPLVIPNELRGAVESVRCVITELAKVIRK